MTWRPLRETVLSRPGLGRSERWAPQPALYLERNGPPLRTIVWIVLAAAAGFAANLLLGRNRSHNTV